MKLNQIFALSILATVLLGTVTPLAVAAESQEEIQESIKVFTEMSREPKTQIPPSLLQRSKAIAIFTNVKQGGFIVGARRGDGVLMIQHRDGSWSNPAFITITGGSIGLQAGVKSSDIILVFPSQAALDKVLSGAFELGGSVSGTAGPVGEQPVESLDGFEGDKAYIYSRSEGLFGGVTLEGSDLVYDDELNKEFYGQPITPRQIFSQPSVSAPVVVDSLRRVLDQAEVGQL